MAQNVPAIETRALRKEYGPKVAVEELTLRVEPGEAFGFLGPNGAGKTTSVKMLLGLVPPTSGEAQLLGIPCGNPACRQRVGFLPEDFRFHEWLRGYEFLDLHARLHHVPKEVRVRRIPELLEIVDLSKAAEQPLSTYSKGMLQRIGLAQALVHDPALVFLDEPTSGLDPLGRRMVRDVIKQLTERGVTVFLNSHLLSEVELTCSRVAFVAQGRVRLVTDPRHYRSEVVRVDFRVGAVDEELRQGLQRWSNEVLLDAEGHTLTVRLADEQQIPDVTRYIVGHGTDVYGIALQRVSLEELFMRVIESEEPCATS